MDHYVRNHHHHHQQSQSRVRWIHVVVPSLDDWGQSFHTFDPSFFPSFHSVSFSQPTHWAATIRFPIPGLTASLSCSWLFLLLLLLLLLRRRCRSSSCSAPPTPAARATSGCAACGTSWPRPSAPGRSRARTWTRPRRSCREPDLQQHILSNYTTGWYIRLNTTFCCELRLV